MKNKKIAVCIGFVLSALFFLDCFTLAPENIVNKSALETKPESGFAVVELFTSEGCSSCPPADQLLEQLQGDSKNKAIYVLAYHVDYWDRLGWKDRFSKPEFTARQMAYQKWLDMSVIYTPQFIINGREEFAGYDKVLLYEKTAAALKTNPLTGLALNASSHKNSISIDYKISNVQKNSSLLLALVLKKATSSVKRGENSGVLLHHVQVVTEIASLALTQNKGTAVLKKPVAFNAEKYQLIGFIQDNTTGAINGAARTELNTKK